MTKEPLVFAGVCDWAGIVRGKAFPEADLDVRLKKGVGLTHSNIMMSCFGPIYTTPFGTTGDLIIRPDRRVRVEVPFDDGTAERFYLGDIVNTDGSPWEYCPRTFLARALKELATFGFRLVSSFEQEFMLSGVEDRPGATYALDAFRRQGCFGEMLLGAMRTAGFKPDSFLPEYGPRQYEATVAAEEGMRAADAAVVMRELARAVAWRTGQRATFAPKLEPDGIGNGTHIHLSLWNGDEPVTYDPGSTYGISKQAAPFFAGVLAHLPAICAFSRSVGRFLLSAHTESLGARACRSRCAGPRGGVAGGADLSDFAREAGAAVPCGVPRGRRVKLPLPGAGSDRMGGSGRARARARTAGRGGGGAVAAALTRSRARGARGGRSTSFLVE